MMTEHDEERKVVEPELVTDEKYSRAYSEEAFHTKLLRFAGTIGKEGLRSALILYYTLQRKDLPGNDSGHHSRRAGLSDSSGGHRARPDPVFGFTDDIGILAAALAAVAMYVDDTSKAKADAATGALAGRGGQDA